MNIHECVELALRRVEDGWHMAADGAAQVDAAVLAKEVKRLRDAFKDGQLYEAERMAPVFNDIAEQKDINHRRAERLEAELDAARKDAEELRLALLAEQGNAEGAPSGWRNDIGHEWIRDWPSTATPHSTIRWSSVRGDPVGGYVLMGKIRAVDIPAYADLPGFSTTPDGEESWFFATALAVMQSADHDLFESRQARCIARALKLKTDGVILWPPNGAHQQTPAIMLDRLTDPNLTEAVLAVYEAML